MHSNRASFVGASYKISPAMSQREAAIAATHEEAHGILRRSTLYGHLLYTQIPSSSKFLPASDVVAHQLYSRGRTTEEIHATFGSIAMAKWAGDLDACARELTHAPEYKHYFNVGEDLTKYFDSLPLKAIVLEGLVRFCWSSRHLEVLFESPLTHERIRLLPKFAYPDTRFRYVRRDWERVLVNGLLSEIGERKQFDVFRKMSFGEIHDPIHEDRKDLDGYAVSDSGSVLQEQMAVRSMLSAIASEAAVNVVADYLSKYYENTEMHAATVERSHAMILQLRNAVKIGSSTLGIIEQIDNLVFPRRLHVVDHLEWERRHTRLVICIRPTDSFVRNFDGGENAQTDTGDPLTIYATTFDLYTSPHDPTDQTDITMALCPTSALPAADRLREWMPEYSSVLTWSSLLAKSPAVWRDHFSRLAEDDRLPWVVVDCDPLEALRVLRPYFDEVTAFSFTPVAAKPQLESLSITTMFKDGAQSSGLRGFIIMGMRHTLEHVMMRIQRELGDCFRGLNPPIYYEQTRQKFHESRALSQLLARTEHSFCFGDQNA